MASISGYPQHHAVRDVWHVPRSRGAISGLLLIVLGVWGGLVPFWGPQFGYGYTPGVAWGWTWTRFFLEVLPAAAAIVGGLGLLLAGHRVTGIVAGWLAAAAGAWFLLGPTFSVLYGSPPGAPMSTTVLGSSVTVIGFFYGLGVVVLFLAAFALGRFSVLPGGQVSSGAAVPVGQGDSESG